MPSAPDLPAAPRAAACPVCGADTAPAGRKRGLRTQREFALRRCGGCRFGYVADPWTDYAQIYDEAYYAGRGSDPSVDYAYEFAHPERTVRRYEWRGLVRAVSHLLPAPAKWLDYGCGNGGLVRYAAEHTQHDIAGFDTGAWAAKARAAGVTILTENELAARQGAFDVITAVEVIEHCVDPLAMLRTWRRLLRPNGLLFLTTGNADTAPADFARWYYVSPEIHVSYFTSRALRIAFEQTGFKASPRGFLPGWDDVMRFKILKRFGVSNVGVLERVLPWRLLARWADRKTALSAHPLGWAA